MVKATLPQFFVYFQILLSSQDVSSYILQKTATTQDSGYPNSKTIQQNFENKYLYTLTDEEILRMNSSTLCYLTTSEAIGPLNTIRIVQLTSYNPRDTWSPTELLTCLNNRLSKEDPLPSNLKLAATDIMSLIPSHFFYNFQFFQTFSFLMVEGLNADFIRNEWKSNNILLSLYLELVDYHKLIADRSICRALHEVVTQSSRSFWRFNNANNIWKLFPCSTPKTFHLNLNWIPIVRLKDMASNTNSQFEFSQKILNDKRLEKEVLFFTNFSRFLDTSWSSAFLRNVFSAKTDVNSVQQISSNTDNFLILQNIEATIVSTLRKIDRTLAMPHISLTSDINSLLTVSDDFDFYLSTLTNIALPEAKHIAIADIVNSVVSQNPNFITINKLLTQMKSNVLGLTFEQISQLNTRDSNVIDFFRTRGKNLNDVQKFIHAEKTMELIGRRNLLKNLFHFGQDYMISFGIFNFDVDNLMQVLEQGYMQELGFYKSDFFSKSLQEFHLRPILKSFILDQTPQLILNVNTSKSLNTFENVMSIKEIKTIPSHELLDVAAILDTSRLSEKSLKALATRIKKEFIRSRTSPSSRNFLKTLTISDLRLIGGTILKHFDIEDWNNLDVQKCWDAVELIGATQVCENFSPTQRRNIANFFLTNCASVDRQTDRHVMRTLGNLVADMDTFWRYISTSTFLENISYLEGACWDRRNGAALRGFIINRPELEIKWETLILSLQTGIYNIFASTSEFSNLLEKSSNNSKIEESLLLLSRQTPRSKSEENFHKVLIAYVHDKIFPRHPTISGCWQDKKLSNFTCHKLRSLGPSIRFLQVEALVRMNSCELLRCLDYITNNPQATEEQLETLAIIYETGLFSNDEFSSTRHKIVSLSKSLPYLSNETIVAFNLDFQDENVLYQLGRIPNWKPTQLTDFANSIKRSNGLAIESLDSKKIKIIGNILCGFTSTELTKLPRTTMRHVFQNLGKLMLVL